jgi:RNA polymerase sigma-70 factor (ECF subfamily)
MFTVEWQADRSYHAMPLRGPQPSTAFGLSATDERDNSLDVSPAIDDVVSHFGESMRRTARRHGLSEDEIDDAIQDVRIRLWRALGTGEKIRRAPASYLHRTVVSAAIDFIRRRRARRESVVERDDVSALNIEDTPARADRALDEGEIAAEVSRAIDELVETRRAVVRMYLAGYEREEIASLLGWTEAKTRNLLDRGLDDLRAVLTARGISPKSAGRQSK